MKKDDEVKVETVDEYLARGGNIAKVTFDDAWERESKFGRGYKDRQTRILEKEKILKLFEKHKYAKNA